MRNNEESYQDHDDGIGRTHHNCDCWHDGDEERGDACMSIEVETLTFWQVVVAVVLGLLVYDLLTILIYFVSVWL